MVENPTGALDKRKDLSAMLCFSRFRAIFLFFQSLWNVPRGSLIRRILIQFCVFERRFEGKSTNFIPGESKQRPLFERLLLFDYISNDILLYLIK